MLDIHAGALSDLKNPFSAECIEVVHFHCYNRRLFGGQRFLATVVFENGNTKGEQKFEADSFKVLVEKVDQFVKGLDNNT